MFQEIIEEKLAGCVAHACNLKTQEAEAGKFEANLHSKTLFQRRREEKRGGGRLPG